MFDKKNICIIGYSGHAYVVCDIFASTGKKITAYYEEEEKITNPFGLIYLGNERTQAAIDFLKKHTCFIAIGNNRIRENIYKFLSSNEIDTLTAIAHANASCSFSAKIGMGTMVSTKVAINALVKIGVGVICNTGCIIEHECQINDFAHIAPGAVLAGNVTVGKRSFVGANSVVKEGVKIGNDVVIGAGSVVINDIPDGLTVVGNPAKLINKVQ